jgi:outer membrane protein OmpA-like peptidoglycan-associated protein
MLRKILRKFSFLMVSLLLVGCASQKSIIPSSAIDVSPVTFTSADVGPVSNSGQPTRKADTPIAENRIAVPLSQPVEADKELKHIQEAGSVMEQTPVSKAEPIPEKVSMTMRIQFDTGKANIKPKYYQDVERISDFMIQYPSTSAVIEGYTDDVGKEVVNIKLSYQRAANIRAYLTEKFGIDRSRTRVIGYDCQKPIASNKTAKGRQKNRRGEIHIIETHVSPNNLYSFTEDSNLPKGGFSVVDQESIDAKIKSFQEEQGSATYLSKTVKAPTLELYKMWGGVFSHCAIRIEKDPHSFYQIELQTLPDLKKAGMSDYHRIGAAITLLGMIKDQFDVVEFTNKNEREKLDDKEPPYATMPICIEKNADRKAAQWYEDCLSSYAGSYNPENSLKAEKRTKVFEYNPVTHNCCNFAEEALQACGLAHCLDLGKSSGLNHEPGPLEE